MREIKFRGKRVDNDKWVYGFYFVFRDTHRIAPNYGDDFAFENGIYLDTSSHSFNEQFPEVDPETVGQYTGVKDQTDNEIYEDDILKSKYNGVALTYYRRAGYWLLFKNDIADKNEELLLNYAGGTLTVLGNIHDDQDLLT